MNVFESSLRKVEAGFNLAFTESWNPWYQLGALAMFCFWIVAVSGVYLFIFFDTSIIGAYDSVESMTHNQWYLGGVMRSLHRYASDAMAITVTLHLLRELVLGRFRGVRWFSWFSGIPLLWLMFAAAIGGYWLVWDELAQYIAVSSSEWIDWLPIFGDALARNFLSDITLSDRFFSFLVFLHVALPLFLLFGIFIHIKRIKLAKINPARGLMIGFLIALVCLSFVKPALSMARADLSQTVAVVDLDWFYLNTFPLLDSLGPGPVWGLLVSLSLCLAVLPWLWPQQKVVQFAPAIVNPDNCNGCSWCFQDCPYDAIIMVPHQDKPRQRQAVVDPDLCTACGICEGSCPSATPFRHVDELVSGIEIPGFPLDDLRKKTEAQLKSLQGTDNLVLFGCDHALDVERLQETSVAVVTLPCTGALPPSFADYIARKENVSGVMISGCHPNDCYFRKGSEWTEQRFNGERMPHLRTKAGKHKVRTAWAGQHEQGSLVEQLKNFRKDLGKVEAEDHDKSLNTS
jgi:quinol-cytochrome oxidoreductase complex cytochrome b subunit/coenzyme F420-reducing hydrogenase delta subunit/NAD-dependent dihydropyrimidine dehydrogenase PreA subunit